MDVRLLLIVFSILMSANAANAAFANFYPADNEISIFDGGSDPRVNMSWLDSQIGNDAILSHNETTYYLNATLRLYDGSKFDICPPICTKLIMNSSGKIYFVGGDFNISNVEIVSGN